MGIPMDLVTAKIEQARARGDFERAPLSDEARLLHEMEELLGRLQQASGREAVEVRERLRGCEKQLCAILDRTGQGIYADALWDERPSFDEAG